ncbi:hypothetical protein KW800_01430 [Candidatus Parcubacteria bacterium]|nr:hypothetical protein [Candidatus Parcubacteria bacterium]
MADKKSLKPTEAEVAKLKEEHPDWDDHQIAVYFRTKFAVDLALEIVGGG